MIYHLFIFDILLINFATFLPAKAANGIRPVSLGKRILRCETAAIAVLSLIMIRLEIAAEQISLED